MRYVIEQRERDRQIENLKRVTDEFARSDIGCLRIKTQDGVFEGRFEEARCGRNDGWSGAFKLGCAVVLQNGDDEYPYVIDLLTMESVEAIMSGGQQWPR